MAEQSAVHTFTAWLDNCHTFRYKRLQQMKVQWKARQSERLGWGHGEKCKRSRGAQGKQSRQTNEHLCGPPASSTHQLLSPVAIASMPASPAPLPTPPGGSGSRFTPAATLGAAAPPPPPAPSSGIQSAQHGQ